MQLTVRNIAAEDTWKDIVRIKKKFRQRVSNSSDGPPQVVKFPSLVLAPSKRSSKCSATHIPGKMNKKTSKTPVVRVVQFRGGLENLSDCGAAP